MIKISKKLKKNNFFTDSVIYTLSNFATAGVPFFLLPFLTRALEPSDYGVITMFSMVVAFFFVGVGLNIHGAVSVKYFSKEKYDMQKYVSTALIVLVGTSLLMLGLVSIVGQKIAAITSVPLEWLYVAVLVAFLQFFVQILLTLWQASKKPVHYGVFRILNALLDSAGSIFMVVVLVLSWQGRLSAIVAASMCSAIVAAFFFLRESLVSRSFDSSYAKDALNYGIPLVPHALGGLLLGMADRFMINNVLDVSSTGIYMVAVQLGLVLGILVDSFNKTFAPWLMDNLSSMNEAIQKKIVTFTFVYFVVIIALAILGALVTDFILPLVVGPQFQASGPLLIYIFLGNAFMGMYYMVTNYIFYSGKTGLLSILTITIGGITVGLSWFLINAYGIVGAAMGFMIGQASLFISAWVLSNYCVPMPWLKFLQYSRINH